MIAILGAHEMGHYLACRYYRVPATLPFFLPFFIPYVPTLGTLGAVIRIRGVIPHRRALFDIAAAGPIAGFVVALPVLAWGLATAEPFPTADPGPGAGDAEGAYAAWVFGRPGIYRILRAMLVHDAGLIEMNALMGAGWFGLLMTSLNLFPVGQLDGGHAAYALSRTTHRRLTRLTLIALGGLIAFQLTRMQFPAYVLWFAILLWMRTDTPVCTTRRSPSGRDAGWSRCCSP